jgi:hypothetical protein
VLPQDDTYDIEQYSSLYSLNFERVLGIDPYFRLFGDARKILEMADYEDFVQTLVGQTKQEVLFD